MEKDYVILLGNIETETDQAVLIDFGHFDGQKHWIPKSVMRDFNSTDEEFEIEEWFASKEGLI